MRDFFRGWRRKVGGVTLVMALALLSVWVRSFFHGFGVDVYTADRCDTFASFTDGVMWKRRVPTVDAEFGEIVWWDAAPHDREALDHFNQTDGQEPEWHHQWCGFHLGQCTDLHWPSTLTILIVPHWSLVLSLTLLAGYLILWVPLKRLQKKHEDGNETRQNA